jgi:hypothetical protein
MCFCFPSSAFFYINASGGWSRLFRQIVGADAVSSADGASSPAKGDCAKSIGIIIAIKNNDYRVIHR